MISFTRVFTEAGTVAHILDGLLSPNAPNAALCGRQPNLWWHGTGSQDEIERAQDLRLCPRCEDILKQRSAGVKTR